MGQPKISYLSTVPLFLELLYGNSLLSIATGFCWRHSQSRFLVSNYHVFSGKHPDSGQPLSAHGTTPDRVRVYLHNPSRLGTWHHHEIDLFDQQGRPAWQEHPTLGHRVDVAAMPFVHPPQLSAFPLNDFQSDDIRIEVGEDVFVIGFPKGVTGMGRFPIWKRGSIASEPLIPLDGLPRLLIDCATREGMSGSPVVAQFTGVHAEDPANLGPHDWIGTGRALLGIYSGRIASASQLEAQLGFVWNASTISETVESGNRPV